MAMTYVSDSIALDTSSAPWLAIAAAQEKLGVRENKDFATFKRLVSEEIASIPLIANIAVGVVRPVANSTLPSRNSTIAGYLRSVKTDAVKETDKGWQMNAWCAAFVNWCLLQSQAPALGLATAAAWLRFGTPLPGPVTGCVTIFKPLTDTGSSTGHVAFFTGDTEGKRIYVLGGNQSGRVKRSGYPIDAVRGYRWPTKINYLLSSDIA